MKTVLVFKTTVNSKKEVHLLRPLLNKIVEHKGSWNFDLEDCDKILRVETISIEAISIACILKDYGFKCEELQS